MEKSIKKAKQINILDLYQGQLKRSGRALIGNCPFHEDRTPSFAYYEETNSWYCFKGCGGGSSIDFYMKLHDVDFKEAVKQLIK